MFDTFKQQFETFFNVNFSSENVLYTVDIDKDYIWQLYLDSFATDELRQEHTCNSCKQFLRQYAGIVKISSTNTITTLWDMPLESVPLVYVETVARLNEYVRSLPVYSVFVAESEKCGTDKNYDSVREKYWQHFFVQVQPCHVITRNRFSHLITEKKELLQRSFAQITLESCETVLDLIDQNALYRGTEFRKTIAEFYKLHKQHAKVRQVHKDNFCWRIATITQDTICRIKNSAIGTLLVALSEVEDIERAISAYERIVAPTNYKRPTALVTSKMIDTAKKTLEDAGYIDSLERRFATPEDVTVNNVLFIDKSSGVMDVFDTAKKEVRVDPRKLNYQQIPMEHFLTEVVPNAMQIQLLPEHTHLNNFVTLLTGVHADAKPLFKWPNAFSWYYTNGVTDSIKQRVKEAGGKVDGVLRVSLSWHNTDDLDLHVMEPNNNHIFFGSKKSSTSGFLDVDMNVGKVVRNAVENIAWTDARKMLKGTYTVIVKNYQLRERTDVGFTVEIECNGQLYTFAHAKSPEYDRYFTIVHFEFDGTNIQFKDGMVGEVTHIASESKWGIATNVFAKVKHIMLSPNHWDNHAIGNKHYIFTLDNCVCDEPARGIFNEFLTDDIMQHRKVLEVVGSKITIAPSNVQLSGLGFSDTQRARIFVQVQLRNKQMQQFDLCI